MKKTKIIVVTDGDGVARRAVEVAATNIGGRCISRSAGNPTPLSGKEIISLIKKAAYEPVVVMVDDKGHTGEGLGEQVIRDLENCDELDILGYVAVASNTSGVYGIKVDFSITKDNELAYSKVDKYGYPDKGKIVYGDTVDILNAYDAPVIVGIGDPGKMEGMDNCYEGAPVLTKALEEIIKRSNVHQQPLA